MEVILLEKVRNLGSVGDKVIVKPGFARNFLVPKGKAVRATSANVAKFEARRSELEKVAADSLQAAKARAEKLNEFVLTIKAKAAEEGKLFGSISTRELVKAFAQAGQEIAKSEILMPEGAIRRTGEYAINLQLHSDVVVAVKVNVLPEEITA